MRKNETQSFKTGENDSLDSHQNVARKSETKPLIEIFDLVSLTRRLSGFEIVNNATSIFQKWLVTGHFANIFHYLNFSEEYL